MTTQSKEITTRAKAFSRQGVRTHKFSVSADGTVRVWDSIAGHYTTCHAMTERTLLRIRQEAWDAELLDDARSGALGEFATACGA